MVPCNLIRKGQTLAIRIRGLPTILTELPHPQEVMPAIEDTEEEEDVASLVRKRRVLEDGQDLNIEQVESGAIVGTSGQGNPYRELDWAAASFRLIQFNLHQLMSRHHVDSDLNTMLLQCVDHLVVR